MTTPLLSILIPTYNQEELAIRALDSIPRREDIEVIVSDDCSTDCTWDNVRRFADQHPGMNIKLFRNEQNLGCFGNGNVIGTYATGLYTHGLDNDDYLYTEEYNRVVDSINGEDAIYMNLQTNDGTVLDVTAETRNLYCAPITRIVRREFVKDIHFKIIENEMPDWYYNLDFVARNPVSKFTRIVAYHYNYPRYGSVSEIYRRTGRWRSDA